MKQFLVIVIFFTSLGSNAQETKKYARYKDNSLHYSEGYVIDEKGIKIQGLIDVKDESIRSIRVKFISKDGVKTIYYPTDINGYGFSVYKFISKDNFFYEVIKENNRISLYRVISVSGSSAPNAGFSSMSFSNENEYYYVSRPKEKNFKRVRKKNFDEDFSAYFSDCESLSKRIELKELTYKDIVKIVLIYGYECR